MVAQTVAHFGGLDIACNNAGIEGPTKPLHELSEAEWDGTVDIDLKGVWLCMKHEVQVMLERGGGVILNTASVMGQVAVAGIAPYVSAKHGVIGLTKTAALDYAQQGIRVNAICPGMIRTPMVEQVEANMPGVIKGFEAGIPMGRLGHPNEITGTVLWLCSDAASYMTGQAIAVDGAYTTQ